MYGGTMKLETLTVIVQRKKWMRKTCCLSSTRQDPRASQKVWCILVVDTWFTQAIPSKQSFNIVMGKCIGVPQTLGGSLDTLTLFTHRFVWAQQPSFSRAFRLFRTWGDFGRRLNATK